MFVKLGKIKVLSRHVRLSCISPGSKASFWRAWELVRPHAGPSACSVRPGAPKPPGPMSLLCPLVGTVEAGTALLAADAVSHVRHSARKNWGQSLDFFLSVKVLGENEYSVSMSPLDGESTSYWSWCTFQLCPLWAPFLALFWVLFPFYLKLQKACQLFLKS